MKNQMIKAGAESFANINNIQSACYHYLTDNFPAYEYTVLYDYFCQELTKTDIKPNYIERVVKVALLELTYPVTNPNKQYAWSGRERCAFVFIPRNTWSRHKLSKHTESIIDTIRTNAHKVEISIDMQIK
nr:hypothetical protein [uncultured Moraxella sp.]